MYEYKVATVIHNTRDKHGLPEALEHSLNYSAKEGWGLISQAMDTYPDTVVGGITRVFYFFLQKTV